MTMMQRRRALMGAEKDIIENFVRIGNPTIVNGIMTPSADSWIEMKTPFDPDNNYWEFVFKATSNYAYGWQNIIYSPGIFYQANGPSVAIRLKSEGQSSWDIATGSTNFQLNTNVPTWIKTGLYHNQYGDFYAVYRSTDGVNYTLVQSFNPKTNPIAPGKIVFGMKASNTQTVKANYDLNETYITVNGVVVWKPYT